jgi:hypothetical protein
LPREYCEIKSADESAEPTNVQMIRRMRKTKKFQHGKYNHYNFIGPYMVMYNSYFQNYTGLRATGWPMHNTCSV